jgi:hypothetical protein
MVMEGRWNEALLSGFDVSGASCVDAVTVPGAVTPVLADGAAVDVDVGACIGTAAVVDSVGEPPRRPSDDLEAAFPTAPPGTLAPINVLNLPPQVPTIAAAPPTASPKTDDVCTPFASPCPPPGLIPRIA